MRKRTIAKLALSLAAITLSLPLWSQDKGTQLTGIPIGSPSYDYSTGRTSTTVHIPAWVFDGDLNTY